MENESSFFPSSLMKLNLQKSYQKNHVDDTDDSKSNFLLVGISLQKTK